MRDMLGDDPDASYFILLPNIISVRWAGNVESIGEITHPCGILVRNHERERPLGHVWGK
jgi:hypothetical protein